MTVTGGDTIMGSWKTSSVVRAYDNPALVQNLRAVRNKDDDRIIDVTWVAPSSSVTTPTHYEVQYEVDGNGNWLPKPPDAPLRQLVTAPLTYRLTTATGNSSYRFRVRTATLSGGAYVNGNWRTSSTEPALAKPGQVGSLRATRDTNLDTTINITWTAPSNATGQTSYKVQYKQDNATTWTDAPAETNSKDTSYTFDSALGGSRYVFQVQAVTTLTSGTKLEGSWRSSNTVPGMAAGNIEKVTAERQTNGVADPDSTTIKVTWTESARATVGYDVEYRKDSGSWVRAATHIASKPTDSREYSYESADGLEKYTFRVRGVSGAGNGAWKESDQVDQPPVKYTGNKVGADYITVNVTSGPWWYKYQAHDGWTSCAQVAAGGSHTITNLMPERAYRVDLFKTSACNWNDSSDNFQDIYVTTLSDINDWDKCYNTADCRDIDNPNDFNNHTHKRQFLAAFGVTTSGCDWNTRVQHRHGWPDGGQGQHWHCETR